MSSWFVSLYKEFETKIVEKMKKIVLLAAVAATVGVTLYLSCNQNARCNLKRKVLKDVGLLIEIYRKLHVESRNL